MYPRPGKTDSQIEAIINEWNVDDNTTECSDCEESMAKNHDKENISSDTTTLRHNAEQQIYRVPKNINIALKPRLDNYNFSASSKIEPFENKAPQFLPNNIDANNELREFENNSDNFLINFDGESSCNISISECTKPAVPYAQHASGLEMNIENLQTSSGYNYGNILTFENTSTPNLYPTIENLPVHAEDGLLIISTITQTLQKSYGNIIESANSFDNLPDHSDDEGNILPNESANFSLIGVSTVPQTIVISEELSSNSEVLQETSENGTKITKKGSIRKRKPKSNNISEAKKKKLKDLAKKHKVLESCDLKICQMKCINKIDENRRVTINEQFWELGSFERRTFILNSCECLEVKRRTTKMDTTIRKNTFKYYLKDAEEADQGICKSFFLTTLGYKKSNDKVVYNVLSKTPKGNLQPNPDLRGKQPSSNKISDVEFREHVESFQPTISHYRREHAPNVRYLPSDITVTMMYTDFLTKYPEVKISYETYRQKLKKMNISFARLGHEECSSCEELKLHTHDKDNLHDDCTICINWKTHHEKYTKSRALYREHVISAIKGAKSLHFSADLEKVIMLPRAEGFKEVIFAKRLTVFNECFVPLGEKSSTPAFAALWHEGIAGRCKEQLISTFYAFLISQRDSDSVELWLDNCSSQNKNWCFFSFLVFIVNSKIINCDTISIHYFQPGHTYMSADSFHHQIELSMRKMGKVYDFDDFIKAVQSANKNHVIVKAMTHIDFYNWTDYSSAKKLKDKNRPLISDIVDIKAVRGDYTLKFKKIYDETMEYETLDFLKVSAMKKGGMSFPISKKQPDGFPKSKKENILHVLKSILPENRKKFWRDLPEPIEDIDIKSRKRRK